MLLVALRAWVQPPPPPPTKDITLRELPVRSEIGYLFWTSGKVK